MFVICEIKLKQNKRAIKSLKNQQKSVNLSFDKNFRPFSHKQAKQFLNKFIQITRKPILSLEFIC